MRMNEEKLIEEVKKRRPLWDHRLKSYQSRELKWKLWNEVADTLDVNRNVAQKKFKNLKDIFRREIKRSTVKSRMRQDSLNSSSISEMDSASSISSKWRLFDDMLFLKDCLDTRAPRSHQHFLDEHNDFDNLDSDLSDSIADSFATFDDMNDTFNPLTLDEPNEMIENIQKRKVTIAPTVAGVPTTGNPDKRPKTVDSSENVQVLNTENVKNLHDDDYNFLISFYPYIKRMPDLSKLQFRVRMQELLYNTMAEIEATNTLSNALQVQISYANACDFSETTQQT